MEQRYSNPRIAPTGGHLFHALWEAGKPKSSRPGVRCL